MLFRSERSNTVLESLQLPTGHAPSLNDLLKLLNAAGVKRVQLNSASVYRKRLVSDDGSQFTVFEDDGVKRYGQPIGIVKSTKFKINEQGQIDDDHSKRSASWLYRELRVLTDPLLSKHENIIKLLYYDLVQESAGIVRPALLMERASFGSLDHFLESQSEPISHQDRTLLCEDLTHALLALHTCGIAHGDVKAANALVFGVDCPTAPEGEGEVSQQRRFIAKLADFGSSILLEMGPGSMTYYGTPVTNAPEVERQSSEHPFRAEDVLKCDAYSLGLLYLNVLTGRLDDCLITKNDSVLTYALAQVRGLGLEQEAETFMLGALTKLLPYNPHDRISDLSLILRSNHSLAPQFGRSRKNIERSLDILFGQKDYFQYGWADAAFTEEQIQEQSFADLSKVASSKSDGAGKALFELATAYALGFGTASNADAALDHILRSAQHDYLPAQALFRAWYEGLGRTQSIPIPLETQLDWLSEAVAWGSFFAGASLQRLDPNEFQLSREEFHKRGGFNQYFYPRKIPPEVRYDSARVTLLANSDVTPRDNTYDLLEYAVIHGDSAFVKRLLSLRGINPDYTNQYGESLLLLCCKGGHLETLKVLVEAGSKATTKDASGTAFRDSPLQWLIAYDPEHTEEAAKLLQDAGAQDEQLEPVSWDHPSVDFPGVFPRGYPLHFAVFSNHDVCTQVLLKYWPYHVNQANPDLEVETPLVHAIKMHRPAIAEILIAHKALEDLEANNECLRSVGSVLADEALSYNGLHCAEPGELAKRCIESVVHVAPNLVNATDEYGFTPLMCAAQFHDELAVKALLDAGADANAATPVEYDHRTSLNLLTENKLNYCENQIIELLLQAGADMSQHKTSSGNTLLHLAARDNVEWIARRCLDLQINIDTRDNYGQTPLHVAAMYGSLRVAELLLQRGANTEVAHDRGTYNERDWNGLTPIAVAATRLRKDFITLMLKFGSSPIARPSTGQTIFHLAVSESRTDMMANLVSIPELRQLQVLEMRDRRYGLTPLQLCAAYADKFPHAMLLIQAGAQVNAVANLGRNYTALDIAHHAKEVALEDHTAGEDEDFDIQTKLEEWDKFIGYLKHHNARRDQADSHPPDINKISEEVFTLD